MYLTAARNYREPLARFQLQPKDTGELQNKASDSFRSRTTGNVHPCLWVIGAKQQLPMLEMTWDMPPAPSCDTCIDMHTREVFSTKSGFLIYISVSCRHHAPLDAAQPPLRPPSQFNGGALAVAVVVPHAARGPTATSDASQGFDERLRQHANTTRSSVRERKGSTIFRGGSCVILNGGSCVQADENSRWDDNERRKVHNPQTPTPFTYQNTTMQLEHWCVTPMSVLSHGVGQVQLASL